MMLESTQIIAKIYCFGILGVVYFQVRNFLEKSWYFLRSAEKSSNEHTYHFNVKSPAGRTGVFS